MSRISNLTLNMAYTNERIASFNNNSLLYVYFIFLLTVNLAFSHTSSSDNHCYFVCSLSLRFKYGCSALATICLMLFVSFFSYA